MSLFGADSRESVEAAEIICFGVLVEAKPESCRGLSVWSLPRVHGVGQAFERCDIKCYTGIGRGFTASDAGHELLTITPSVKVSHGVLVYHRAW